MGIGSIVISFAIWLVITLIISWLLGNWIIYKIGLPLKYSHLEEKGAVILGVGFLGLTILSMSKYFF